MKKRKVKEKVRRRTLPKAIRDLAKDPLFAPPERRQGHSALRVRDGRLEIFDPNPMADEHTPETDEFTRYKTRTPAEWFHFCRKMEQRLRVAQREYKKGWDAFYALRRSMATKDYPTLTEVVRSA